MNVRFTPKSGHWNSARPACVRPKRGGGLEIGRELRRKTAMHLAGNLISQHLTIAALEGLERRPHNLLRRSLRRVDVARKVGKPACNATTWVPCRASSRRSPLVSAHAADFDAP